ncbi:F0F1 ATP synthase subunit B [Buchnera aphidicola (Kurisakia onigurumii)]|uniref:F0F1 ATP synthase subunit B n=1 Tax=Buchnera aphidicola TaxID=9 RepID=UPI0031B72850
MNLNATILGQAISFLLFVLICMKFIWPPIIKKIESRKQKIINALESIKKKNIELNKLQKNIKEKIQQSKLESSIILEKAYRNKEKILQETKIEAEKEKIKIIAQAKNLIDLERKKIFLESKKYIGDLSLKIAEKILQKSINKKDNDILIKKIISKL